MNHSIRMSIAVAGVCTAVAAGGVAAQTTAVGPYYATPSWDQTLPGATRFVVLANMNLEAVLDRETGLVWWRSWSAPLTGLIFAQDTCVGSRVGGRRGWRLPTVGEAASLLDPAATAPPFLPPGHPFTDFDPTAHMLWTATPNLGNPGTFYRVGYLDGFFQRTSSAPGVLSRTLCVRGAE